MDSGSSRVCFARRVPLSERKGFKKEEVSQFHFASPPYSSLDLPGGSQGISL